MAISVDVPGPARARWSAGQVAVTVTLTPVTGTGVQGNMIQGSIALPIQGGYVGMQGGAIQGSSR